MPGPGRTWTGLTTEQVAEKRGLKRKSGIHWVKRLALKVALRLVVFVGRRMATQSGQLALDDARLEIQTCLNIYLR